MFLFYNLLLTILAPIWVPWMWWRARKRKEAPNWDERRGIYSLPYRMDGKRVWIHAVSVGETIAALPILRSLREKLPEHEFVLSVTTSSGHRTAREQAVGLYDYLVYFPVDIVRLQLSAMTQVYPSVVAIMETELWINFLWAAKAIGAQTLIVNGRISERSFARSRKVRFFYKTLLGFVDRCLMQTEADKERVLALGARSAECLGSTKFDQALSGLEADPVEWRKVLKLPEGKPVVVIGSTRGEEEEAFVLDAIEEIGLEKVAVVHAPRHLERVTVLAEEVVKRFGAVALRSKEEGGNYLLLDTYGELMKVYCVADVVVIGGGFADLGGHDIMQPLAHGKPVLHGPHMRNFAEFAKATVSLGASRVCSTPHELASTILELLEDPAKRAQMGQSAKSYVAQHADAGERYAQAIADEAAKFKPRGVKAQ